MIQHFRCLETFRIHQGEGSRRLPAQIQDIARRKLRIPMPKLKNIHPGEILREEFLVPLELTPYRLCQDTGLPQSRLSEIINGKRGLSADTALRLARYLGTTPAFWLNLQMAHDLEEAQRTSGREIAAQIKPLKLVS